MYTITKGNTYVCSSCAEGEDRNRAFSPLMSSSLQNEADAIGVEFVGPSNSFSSLKKPKKRRDIGKSITD